MFDDADLDTAIEGAMVAKMRNAGEACTAANRLYVQAGIHDKFVDLLTRRMEALRMGPGIDPATECGPMITAKAVAKIDGLVKDAVGRGAKLLCGGEKLSNRGFFYPPTVLTDVPADAEMAHKEIFGPVAPITRFDTEDEVIAKANHTEYGLSAYVFTKDIRARLEDLTSDRGRHGGAEPGAGLRSGSALRRHEAERPGARRWISWLARVCRTAVCRRYTLVRFDVLRPLPHTRPCRRFR